MDPSLSSQNERTSAGNAHSLRYECRWGFCTITFPNMEALHKHVVVDHCRRTMPVPRRDIPMLIRAEEGIGPSLQLSDLMRDPSASAPQTSAPQQASIGLPTSQDQPPASSLPSPPASSPAAPLQPNVYDGAVSRPTQTPQIQDQQPSFMSLSSPMSSAASIQLPASPSFSALVRTPLKRKEWPGSAEQPRRKQPRLEVISQPSNSLNSNASRNVAQQQFPQSLDSDREDEDYKPHDSSDSETSSSDESTEYNGEARTPGPSMPNHSRTPSGSVHPNTSQDEANLYKTELSWPASQLTSSQLSAPSEAPTQSQNPLHLPESFSQPPSQLALSSFPPQQRDRRPTPSLEPLKTGVDSSIAMPLSSPVAIASPTFAVSTPIMRQSWYAPSFMRRNSKVMAGGSSEGSTPKASPSERHAAVAFSQPPASQTPSQPSQSLPRPSIKKPVFQTGNLATARNTHSPKKPTAAVPEVLSEAKPIRAVPAPPAPSSTLANEDKAAELIQNILKVRDSDDPWQAPQSQYFADSQASQDFDNSYPELQTQAPYQSQTLSQLD